MKKIKCAAISLVFIVIMSNIVVGASANYYTSYSDILLVQIGQDKVLDETCSVIVEEIQNRNTNKEAQYRQAIEEIGELPTFPTLLIEVDLQNVADKNHILTIKRIQVSLSELEEGILEKYKTVVLIIVGHGTQDGLSDKKNIMPWEVVQEVIEDKKAELTFIASCFGGKATHDVNNAYGFVGVVDFQVASYVALSILFDAMGESSLSEVYYNLAISRFFLLVFNPEYGKYLRIVGGGGGGGGGGYTPYLSDIELTAIIMEFVVLFMAVMFNFACSGSAVLTWYQKIAAYFLVAGGLGILYAIAAYWDGEMSDEVFEVYLIAYTVEFVGYARNAFYDMSSVDRVVLIALGVLSAILLFGEAALDTLCAGAVTALKWVIAILSVIAIIQHKDREATDYNDYIG